MGFSGGIDSVTAARYLSEQGLEVTALTLDTVGDRQMIDRARERAADIGIGFMAMDVRDEFSARIIDYFIRSYAEGLTPAPCTRCNPSVKWHYLLEEADRRQARFVATGHYFNIVRHNGKYYVSRADDRTKDQSYYLWGLRQEVLSRALTPMAHVMKREIRERFADKRESMGVCFLRGLGYREFLERRCPSVLREGDVVDMRGRTVGRHAGIAFYTIGQKRGLDCACGKSVVAIDAVRNRLIVGDDRDLYHASLDVIRCNVTDEDELLSADDITVMIRGIGRNPAGFVRRIARIDGGYRVMLDDPAWAPAAGQPVVFYRGDRVVGGGVLVSSGR